MQTIAPAWLGYARSELGVRETPDLHLADRRLPVDGRSARHQG